MHSSSIYTRQRMGIDNNVWISMFTCIVLSAGLFGYNVSKRGDDKPCRQTDIFVNGRINTAAVSFKVGDVLSFRPSVSSGDQISWYFGDDTKREEGFYAVHVFTRKGIFIVRAMINDKCWFDKRVEIRDAPVAQLDTAGNILENISGREDATVGEALTFFTTLPASGYEWFIEDNRFYEKQTGKEASFTFKSQGRYTVVLVLDGDKQRKFTKTVVVSKLNDVARQTDIPKPLILPSMKHTDTANQDKPVEPEKIEPEPVKKKTKILSDDIFRTYLQQVVCNGMKTTDFSDFLCKGENTPVIINNKTRKTFGELCAELRGEKIRIESVVAARDNDNCVVNLTVTYDKKGFLGRNPCKD